MRSPQAREAGCVWTASGQRLQVLVRGADVIVGGVALAHADREAFVRAFFLACAEADDWAEMYGHEADPELRRRCPSCGADPGSPCVNLAWGGIKERPHYRRAQEAAMPP